MASKVAALPAGSKVLDVGAGFCRYRHLFKHCDYKAHDFCSYTGSEWNYGEIDYVSDIVSIPVEDESFDVILNTEVLEHVPEPIKAIAEFARILKPGGVLLLTAPLGCGLHQKPHIYYGGFTPYWYDKFLGEYGFEIEEISPNGGFFLGYAQETGRIMHYLFSPAGGSVKRVLLAPLRGLSALFFRGAIPLWCHWLDRRHPDYDFTVGYFVQAKKVGQSQ